VLSLLCHCNSVLPCLCHCIQDWGFFVSYLLGSISLVVLGVGSVAPG